MLSGVGLGVGLWVAVGLGVLVGVAVATKAPNTCTSASERKFQPRSWTFTYRPGRWTSMVVTRPAVPEK